MLLRDVAAIEKGGIPPAFDPKPIPHIVARAFRDSTPFWCVITEVLFPGLAAWRWRRSDASSAPFRLSNPSPGAGPGSPTGLSAPSRCVRVGGRGKFWHEADASGAAACRPSLRLSPGHALRLGLSDPAWQVGSRPKTDAPGPIRMQTTAAGRAGVGLWGPGPAARRLAGARQRPRRAVHCRGIILCLPITESRWSGLRVAQPLQRLPGLRCRS